MPVRFDSVTFEHSRTVTTSATAHDVWALWSDPGSWHCWDPSVECVALEGHFAEGAAGTADGGAHVTQPGMGRRGAGRQRDRMERRPVAPFAPPARAVESEQLFRFRWCPGLS